MSILPPPAIQLHRAMRSIAEPASSEIMRKARIQALRLLARGVDPNALVDGITPLTRLLTKMTEDQMTQAYMELSDRGKEAMGTVRHNVRFELVGKLLEAGANPWMGTPDTWQYPRLDFGLYLLMILADREQEGHRLRGPQGQTPLHAIMGRADQDLDAYRLHCAQKPQLIHPHWAKARDDRGNTLLHAAWAQVAQAGYQLEGAVAHAKAMTSQFGLTACAGGQWQRHGETAIAHNGGQEMVELLSMANHDGLTVAQLMVGTEEVHNLLLAEDRRDDTSWAAVAEVAHSTSSLELNTKAVSPHPNRGVVRL